MKFRLPKYFDFVFRVANIQSIYSQQHINLAHFQLFNKMSSKAVKFDDGPSKPPSLHADVKRHSVANTQMTISGKNLDPVQAAKEIFLQAVQSVMPAKLITSQVRLEGSILHLANAEGTNVDLSQYKNKHVVGFGKGCLPMAETLVNLLSGQIDRCIVSVPVGSRKSIQPKIEVFQGAENNIPDEASFEAAKAIVSVVQSCTENDLLFIVISGGGSALLPYPMPPVTLQEKQNLIRSLSKAGCNILELNAVRKRLSLVKGGGLIQMCRAKKIIALIVSDIPNSPLDYIASGATVENLDSQNAALDVIHKYNLEDELPASIYEVLTKSPREVCRARFRKVTNFIIGDNTLALEGAAEAAIKLGLRPFKITSTLEGDATEVGYDIAKIVDALAYFMTHVGEADSIPSKAYLETIKIVFAKNNWPTDEVLQDITDACEIPEQGICLLFGGETTVKVQGTGIGGRNQELALAAGIRLDVCRNLPHLKNKVAILSAGTDGIDGPTNAAGAVVEGNTIHSAQLKGISSVEHLKDNNSYNFFKDVCEGNYHIICGHTQTNVMDVAVVVILKKAPSDSDRRKSVL